MSILDEIPEIPIASVVAGRGRWNREGDVGAGPTDGTRGLGPGGLVFGEFGSGNIGNDASLDAALRFLAAAHPDAAVDVMCGGPQDVRDRYHVSATPLLWYAGAASGIAASALKALVKVLTRCGS